MLPSEARRQQIRDRLGIRRDPVSILMTELSEQLLEVLPEDQTPEVSAWYRIRIHDLTHCLQDILNGTYGGEPGTPFLTFMTVRFINAYYNVLLISDNRYRQENVPNVRRMARQFG